MDTYKDLVAQREALDKLIKQCRASDMKDAVEQIQQMIEEFGLTETDVFKPTGKGKQSKGGSSKGKKAVAKYKDPATGVTWSGRGKAPRWFDKDNAGAFSIVGGE